MVPELSSETAAQWPTICSSGQTNIKEIWKFRQLDIVCTAAEETSYSVNLRHALLFAFTRKPSSFLLTHLSVHVSVSLCLHNWKIRVLGMPS